jgi:hypothetical protein
MTARKPKTTKTNVVNMQKGTHQMYGTIEQAETAIESLAQSIGDQKLNVVKIVAEIHHDDLWKQAINPDTQKNFTAFEQWLTNRGEWMNKHAGMGPRQVQRHLKAYRGFCDALDMPEDLLQRAGEHALILAEIANMGRNYELRDEDIPSKTGGQLLGKDSLKNHFNELMNQIDNNPAWRIKNTKQMVSDVKGKRETPNAQWSITATLDDSDPKNPLVHIDTIVFVRDGQAQEFISPAPMPYPFFKDFVKSQKADVSGLQMPKDM